MPKLTETAYYTRKTIKYGSITLLVLIIGRVVLTGAINYWKAAHPKPPPPPTVGFGQLPQLSFPNKESTELSYTLETVSGSVPTISDRGTVYFMPIIRPNLLALQRATETATNLSFVFEPQSLSERLYRFSKSSPLPSRLDFDIVTGNFDLRVDWFTNPNFLQQRLLPSDAQAISEAQNYLGRADLMEKDLVAGESKITYLKGSGKGYQKTVSLSEADFIQIDFFRKEIEPGIVSITSDPTEGIVRVTISGSRNQGERIVFVKYDYFPIDSLNFETYPIKSGQAAWEELISGGGYIVSPPQGGNQAIVRSITIGYYDAFEPQNYFQPVYIFSGDKDFTAIVPAIDNTWIQQE